MVGCAPDGLTKRQVTLCAPVALTPLLGYDQRGSDAPSGNRNVNRALRIVLRSRTSPS